MGVLRKRIWFLIISLGMIMPGIVFLIIAGGLRTGIDFTGGSSMQVQFSEDVTQEELRTILEQEGYINAVVQGMGENIYFLRTTLLVLQDSSLSGGTQGRLSAGYTSGQAG